VKPACAVDYRIAEVVFHLETVAKLLNLLEHVSLFFPNTY
jgi:hypothetical protein